MASRATLFLPVPEHLYREVVTFTRKYAAIGVSGTMYHFYIPPWVQIEGTARVKVQVRSRGFAETEFEITAPTE